MFELKNRTIKISVRNLVEFLFRSGDIRSGKGALVSEKGMEAGSRIHRMIQKSMPVSYQSEVALKTEIDCIDYKIIIDGRADGIDKRENEVFIDEIKGTYRNLDKIEEPDYVHLAQALCYGYFYMKDTILETIGIQVTYVQIESEEVKRFKEEWSREKLTEWFEETIVKFRAYTDLLYHYHEDCVKTAAAMKFPFSYRKGQKDMAAAVYYAIREQKKLFVQAPTGVGKTISTLFPAIKALGEEKASRIFYLTAKTITRTVAEDTIKLLQRNGLLMRCLTITAKDKLCVCEKRECNPEHCERAKGHFNRINAAVYDLASHEIHIDRDKILSYAEKHQVCPYELCLDVSLFVETIICDYNYAFDPTVKLKRYFQSGKGEYLFLIDETHNLVDRAREMYSASLYKTHFLTCRKFMKEIDQRVYQKLGTVNRKMLEIKKQCHGFTLLETIDSLVPSLILLKNELDRFFEEEPVFEEKDQLLELYFDLTFFLTIYDEVNHCYKIYADEADGEFYIKLFCIQPCDNLELCLNMAVSAIFFSATILPVEYYKKVLCGNKEEFAVYIPSPFEEEKRLLMIGDDVSTLYSKRGYEQYYRIYLHLIAVMTSKKGNYIAFFPSYQMMDEIVNILYEEGYPSEYRLLVQDSSMMEQEKDAFLKEFEQGPVFGCCVLGGVFSEGIDLTGDRLIGTILVGTGLPKVSGERDMLRQYYEETGEDGFSYAYLYPGMNKILQAAGRVIRTADDEGIILLLDERFLRPAYQKMFPMEWSRYKVVNRNNTKRALIDFWKERDNEI